MNSRDFPNRSAATSRGQARLLAIGTLALFFLMSIAEGERIEVTDVVAAGLIMGLGIRPMMIWLQNPERFGLPIFPLHAASMVWGYGLPILTAHDVVLTYTPGLRLWAAVLIGLYLALGTEIWRWIARRPVNWPARIFVLRQGMTGPVLYLFLFMGALFEVMQAAGSLEFLGTLGSVARAIFTSLFILSVFSVAFRWGQGELKPRQKLFFLACLVSYGLAICSGLFLIGGLLITAASIGGYFFGAKKIPWIPVLLVAMIFSLLHLGKESMRTEYWSISRALTVAPSQYPPWYSNWLSRGVDRLTADDQGQQSSRSLLERASLLHMLLLTMEMAPDQVPFLHGETYSKVPLIVAPRFLAPNKPSSHEATTILSVQYGLQLRESAVHTTIGWGLIAEAYANFGVLGVLALAGVTSLLFGGVAIWARGFPIGSARMLMAFLVTFMALNSEYTSTVFVSVLFQSSVAVALALGLMRRQPTLPVSIKKMVQ